MKKVFLGGTCANSTWREKLIPNLKIDYFNPVVENWTEECYQAELEAREYCDYCLYVITPRMEGVYAIAEIVDDAHRRPSKTVFCFIEQDDEYSFTSHQIKSLQKVGVLVEKTGAIWCRNFNELQDILI